MLFRENAWLTLTLVNKSVAVRFFEFKMDKHVVLRGAVLEVSTSTKVGPPAHRTP